LKVPISTGSFHSITLTHSHSSINDDVFHSWATEFAESRSSWATADDNIVITFSRRPFGLEYRPRHPCLTHSMLDITNSELGLIVTEILPGSYAEEKQLKEGMILLEAGGYDLRSQPWKYCEDLLRHLALPVTCLFSQPLRSDLTVTIDSVDSSGHLDFRRNCMMVSSVGPIASQCGLKEGDEIVQVNGNTCFKVLGNSRKADRYMQDAVTRGVPVELGVRRAGLRPDDPCLNSVFILPSVFSYASALGLPHTATGPYLLGVPGQAAPVACFAWFSHGGCVISFKPLNFSICVGVYVEDITSMSTVEDSSLDSIDHDIPEPTPPSNRAVPFCHVGHIHNDAGIHDEEDVPEMVQAPKGRFQLCDASPIFSEKIDYFKDANKLIVCDIGHDNKDVSETSQVPNRPLQLCDASLIVSHQIDYQEVAAQHAGVENNDDKDNISFDTEDKADNKNNALCPLASSGASASSRAVLQETKKLTHSSNNRGNEECWIELHFKPKEGGVAEQCCESDGLRITFSSRWQAEIFRESLMQAMHRVQPQMSSATSSHANVSHLISTGFHAPHLPADQVAKNLGYHFWGTDKITRVVLHREHVLPKLFKFAGALTRVERYTTLTCALQTGFFIASFFFSADCLMVPKPAVCTTKKKHFVEQFLPTWSTFFATITGLMFSVPVPLILINLFKKSPVLEVMTPEEKRFQIQVWRCKQMLGWMLVLGIHVITGYWFVIFSNEYDWPVFGRWANAGLQGLIHRFVTAPVLRGLIFLLVVLLSKYFACCDFLLVFFPHIVPADDLVGTVQKDGDSNKRGDEPPDDGADQDVDCDVGDCM